MTPTDKFWQFLEPIVTGVEGVVYTQMSDGNRMDRFSAASVKKVVYPGVFVMRPRFQTGDNGAGLITAKFDISMYVLVKSKQSDVESQDLAFSVAERIAADIVKAIKHDNLIRMIDGFDLNSVQMEAVKLVTVDSCDGYELRFKLLLPVGELFC